MRRIRGVPISLGDEREHRRILASRLLGATRGQLNVVEELSVTAATTETTVVDPLVTSESVVLPVPFNAAAGALLDSGPWWVEIPAETPGQFVLHHVSAAGGEVFRYAVFGG